MKLSFHGAARSVTGANYLFEVEKTKILIDCGLFQGCRFCEENNFNPFPYDSGDIDFVFLTHAHTDHIGRLPKLIRDGFRGKIFGTPPTLDLLRPMLFDTVALLKDEARREGHQPLFIKSDVEKIFPLLEKRNYDTVFPLTKDISVTFRDAGHILGSSIIEIRTNGGVVVFSGDLGNPPTPLLKTTEKIEKARFVVMESTYGDRVHEDKDERKNLLEDAIEDAITNGGVLMIPTFALERTQELLVEINDLVEHNRIPQVPVFIDSPLAIAATEIYKKYPEYYNEEALKNLHSPDELFKFPGLTFTRTVDQSKAINDVPSPKVIIAGSGMSNGGRILHHERRYLSDPKSLLLIIGYQAAGTLGRRLFNKEKEVKIFGESVPVRAKVKAIGGYSAHADQPTLLRWLDAIERPIEEVFVVQGEEAPALALTQKIRDTLGIHARAPILGEHFTL